MFYRQKQYLLSILVLKLQGSNGCKCIWFIEDWIFSITRMYGPRGLKPIALLPLLSMEILIIIFTYCIVYNFLNKFHQNHIYKRKIVCRYNCWIIMYAKWQNKRMKIQRVLVKKLIALNFSILIFKGLPTFIYVLSNFLSDT